VPPNQARRSEVGTSSVLAVPDMQFVFTNRTKLRQGN
jgi:hypothetical protein